MTRYVDAERGGKYRQLQRLGLHAQAFGFLTQTCQRFAKQLACVLSPLLEANVRQPYGVCR